MGPRPSRSSPVAASRLKALADTDAHALPGRESRHAATTRQLPHAWPAPADGSARTPGSDRRRASLGSARLPVPERRSSQLHRAIPSIQRRPAQRRPDHRPTHVLPHAAQILPGATGRVTSLSAIFHCHSRPPTHGRFPARSSDPRRPERAPVPLPRSDRVADSEFLRVASQLGSVGRGCHRRVPLLVPRRVRVRNSLVDFHCGQSFPSASRQPISASSARSSAAPRRSHPSFSSSETLW